MFDYKKIFKNREFRLKLISGLRFIPSVPYLKIVYKIKTGNFLNLRNPKLFTEKLNWLKLNDIHSEYTQLVDKIAVRDYIKSVLGEDICFPMLGQWEHYNQIDFSKLPKTFVLKCNHDSGSVKIIKDKDEIDHNELERFFESRIKQNPYNIGREYPYKNVKPMILAEKNMVVNGQSDINDYKFFCFNGEPKIMFVATERSSDCKFDFYDMDFNHLDITNIHPQSSNKISKPKCFEEMKNIVTRLSCGMKFVRIDLYEIDNKVYFGEFTFFHAGGFWKMNPEEWEVKLGDWIIL